MLLSNICIKNLSNTLKDSTYVATVELGATLLSSPCLSYAPDILEYIPCGEVVHIIGIQKDFSEVWYQGMYGWVENKYINFNISSNCSYVSA